MSEDPSDFREQHLRSGDFLGAFAVVRRHRQILMVRNQRVVGGVPTETWDLPGGQVEPGELLEEALCRELEEETGIRVVGEPVPRNEIREVDWFSPDQLEEVLLAPYHDSFRAWLRDGGTAFRSIWRD